MKHRPLVVGSSPDAAGPARRSRWEIAWLPLALATGGGGMLALLGWRGSGTAMHPAPASIPWALDDFPELTPETVKVQSRTGVTLMGRFFRGGGGATIILSHGYGGNQDEMLPVAATLHSAGFNVFTYNLRGCGTSGGEVTLGALEQEDLRSVVDVVAARSDVDGDRIGALGFSMGAATTLLEAADDGRIKAVVADSAWSDVRHWVRPRLRDLVLRPTWHFSPVSLKLLELRTGARLRRLRPVNAVPRVSPRPILIIHGGADEVVPPNDSELNHAAASGPRDLWMVEGAAHGDTVRPGGATTGPRVTGFFDGALRV
jgi:dipeptidyl aminopeptidase/acylaminoacyl peptidase